MTSSLAAGTRYAVFGGRLRWQDAKSVIAHVVLLGDELDQRHMAVDAGNLFFGTRKVSVLVRSVVSKFVAMAIVTRVANSF